MTRIEQARHYLSRCKPAVSGQGGHNTTFALACQVIVGFALNESEAMSLLGEWNRTCQPPWSERDLEHKVSEAMKAPASEARGHMIREDRSSSTVARQSPRPKESHASNNLPDPIDDGTTHLVRHCFTSGEGVRICPAYLDEDGKERPDGGGVTLTREQWLAKLDAQHGNPNGIWTQGDGAGIYIAINPYKPGTTKDADVTSYRHALIEFDEGASPAEQLNLYTESNLPISAIIFSGKRSVHAWVLVEAQDLTEYKERVQLLYDYFAEKGFECDAKNKNPGRLSRLPGCRRFDSRQELLSGRCGAKSFTEWLASRQVAGLGREMSPDQLLAFDFANDPACLIGRRYLCRSGSMVTISTAGAGKSSLAMMEAVAIATGTSLPWFKVNAAYKVLLIQAENDEGDMAEAYQGVLQGMSIDEFNAPEKLALLRQNLVMIQDSVHVGRAFIDALQKHIDHHRPQFVSIDPILSFIGGDISKVDVCAEFFSQWLNPISQATGVCWLVTHHTGKPAREAKPGQPVTDYDYVGLGSSGITNWARAIRFLEKKGGGNFVLHYGKRGSRAQCEHPDGNPTVDVWLKHSHRGICWEHTMPQSDDGEGGASWSKNKPKRSVAERLLSLDLDPIISTMGAGMPRNALALAIEQFAANAQLDISAGSARRIIESMVQRGIVRKHNGLYFPPGEG